MPKTSGAWTTFAETDVYATGDANYIALGLHVKRSIDQMLAITPDRRKSVFRAKGANTEPLPVCCFVADKGDGKPGIYYLINEPGTDETTLADWQIYSGGAGDGQGLFDPNSTTLADGTGTTGHYYIAKNDGTFNGDVYERGDWTVYNGTAWERLPIGVSALPGSAHTHEMDEVNGLELALANKVDTSNVTATVYPSSKLPTNNAIIEYTYSKEEVADLFAAKVTYGLRFVVNALDELNDKVLEFQGTAEPVTVDTYGLVEPERKVYRWDGTSWVFAYDLDAVSGGSGDLSGIEYIPTTDSIHASNWNAAPDTSGLGSLNLSKDSQTLAPNSVAFGGGNNIIQADHANSGVMGLENFTTRQSDTYYFNNIQVLGRALDANGNLFGSSTPPAPDGVTWNVAPTAEYDNNTAYISDGEANVQGTLKTVPGDDIPVTLEPSGKKRPYRVVADYGATPVFELVSGEQSDVNAGYAFPALPENRLNVTTFMATSAGIVTTPNGGINTIILNGKTFVGNANGEATGEITASEVPYTPADATYFSASELMVKAAFDELVTKVKAKVNSFGGVIFHDIKRFTPLGNVTVTGGTTVTAAGNYFNSSTMVGNMLIINGEERIIVSRTDTVATVDKPYSQNFSAVTPANWGVYAKAFETKNGTNEIIAYRSNGSTVFSVDTNGNFVFAAGSVFLNSASTFGLGNTSITSSFFDIASGNAIRVSGDAGNENAAKVLGLMKNALNEWEAYDGVSPGTLRGYNADYYKENGVRLADKYALKPEAFTPLTIGATTTWATAGRMLNNKTLTLTQNTVLDFTGLANGAEGTLELIQDATGGRTFIPPAGSKPATVLINSSPNGITLLGWKKTGTYIYWTSKGFY